MTTSSRSALRGTNPPSPSAPRWPRWLYAGLAALAFSEIAIPLLFGADHAHFSFEDLPAWGSLYGLLSCVAIIVVSKLLGKLWLTHPENYYDR